MYKYTCMHAHTLAQKKELKVQEKLIVKLILEFKFPIFATYQYHGTNNSFHKEDKPPYLI